ncbi:MAG: His/Gly/Thr/Pro-type tRNA ligase C-terminal domain-containing protein [Planctomycetes bacterium]|jgi:prolyl-tRNA synthetase|nr:His/Gly/Thr/Pro-type tRNA ligase C-terminal domain-containing protein [Planctomycetota bacterium]
MKQSLLFVKTAKDAPKDEQSFNAQILMRAGFIDKLGAGIYTFLPFGLRVLNKINNIVREEINKVGGQEILMPALNPKEVWEKTNRWATFDALFRLKGNDEKEYALGATHEEIVTPLAKKFILSYKDLPFAIYQIQTKFRNEKRAKAGLLRGREFVMKDLYSFHISQEDLDNYYETVKQAYYKIYERLGLSDITYLTYASGGAFSKYSHEFQTVTEMGEDSIYVCDKCKVAVNKEIIAEQSTCPVCGAKDLIEKRAIEVGNIFKLGTKFSNAFEITYQDQNGDMKEIVMGCYGFGPSRVMGTIAEIFHDDKGLLWPEAIAPFKIHLLSLNQNEEAEKVYQTLTAKGIEVLYDDRDLPAGQKFFDADLIGCPYRLVIGKSFVNSQKLELKKRGLNAKEELLTLAEILLKF